MSRVLIVYGSTGGNTELVCDHVAHLLSDAGHEVRNQRAEHSTPEQLGGHDLVILASSTYGHGILQEHMAKFAAQLRDADFNGMAFAVIGLGDPKYDREYNIESAAILEALVQERGGSLVCDALKVNRNPVPKLNKQVKGWAESLANQLGN